MSSAVAAAAIVGGYLGVRSANSTAVNIAREERSAQRKDNFDILRRSTYAEGLAALTEASRIFLLEDVQKEVPKLRDIEKMLNLIAPKEIIEEFDAVLKLAYSRTRRNAFESELETLTAMMRRDLEGVPPSTGNA